MFAAVILQNQQKKVVPIKWVHETVTNKVTKIFISKDRYSQPNFHLNTYYFIQRFKACYHGFFLKKFPSEKDALEYCGRKRKHCPYDFKTLRRIEFPYLVESAIYEINDNEQNEQIAVSENSENERNAIISNSTPNQNWIAENERQLMTRQISDSGTSQTKIVDKTQVRDAIRNVNSAGCVGRKRSTAFKHECASTASKIPKVIQNPTEERVDSRFENKNSLSVHRTSNDAFIFNDFKSVLDEISSIVPSVGDSSNMPIVTKKISATKFKNRNSSSFSSVSSTVGGNQSFDFNLTFKSDKSDSYSLSDLRSSNMAKKMTPNSSSNIKRMKPHTSISSTITSASRIFPLKLISPNQSRARIGDNMIWNASSNSENAQHTPNKQICSDASNSAAEKVTANAGTVQSSFTIPEVALNMATEDFDLKSKYSKLGNDRENIATNNILPDNPKSKVLFHTSILDEPYRSSCNSFFSSNIVLNPQYIKQEGECEIDNMRRELERNRRLVALLDQRAGPEMVPDSDQNDTSDDLQSVSDIEHAIEQKDSQFSGDYRYTTDRDANRYYLDGAIRIGRNTLIILKNFNKNVITKGKEFDYRFVSRLLLQIFPKEVLRQCSASTNNMRNTAYARLDIEKYTFMEELFSIRVERNSGRKGTLPSLINRKCASLRSEQLK